MLFNKLSQNVDETSQFFNFTFCKDNKPLQNGPVCGMTLKAAGSMRFRWNEKNERRDALFSTLALRRKIIPVELVHSKTVFDIKNGDEAHNQTGDGLISIHPDYFLTVTVADCMPLFFI